eukprot:7126437-Pyramimonas_sp.AAC.1
MKQQQAQEVDDPAPTQAVTKVVKKKASKKETIYRMWVDPIQKSATFDILDKIMKQRIVVIDGAMGTMVQRRKLQEPDFRGT